MNLTPGSRTTTPHNNFNPNGSSAYIISSNNNQRNNRGGGSKGVQNGRGISGGSGNNMNRVNRMTLANSKTGHSVHMRGLPFESTASDVVRFFAPLQPVDIRLLFESNTGRPKGECDVDFTTHRDAEEAMKRDKQNMGMMNSLP